MRKRALLIGLLVAACFLTGCEMRTVEEMYWLPKRPESYYNLQSAIDKAMDGKEYCAPLSGSNVQPVQMVDLDGDGEREYLLFAKSKNDRSLQLLVFRRDEEKYVLAQIVDMNGTDFDQVEYVQMDGRGGMEIVVGRQLGSQGPRTVSAYASAAGKLEQIMATEYARFLPCDLDADRRNEVFILRPGQNEDEPCVAELYTMDQAAVVSSGAAPVSGSPDQLKRILSGKVREDTPGVFVESTAGEDALVTDVYALINGEFVNISLPDAAGSNSTLRNEAVYAADIDGDGVVELPALIPMKPPEQDEVYDRNLIRWYALRTDGGVTYKLDTYHHFENGWYIRLEPSWSQRICVVESGNACRFYLWDSGFSKAESVFTIYTLTGQDREEQAVTDNRFVLQRADSVLYAARLDVASGSIPMSREDLANAFNMIRPN